MRLKALKDLPTHRKGAVFETTPELGRVFLLLLAAEEVHEAPRRQSYRRRDLRADE